LIWTFTPQSAPDLVGGFAQHLEGGLGRGLARGGIAAALVEPDGTIRAASALFAEQAAGDPEASLAGTDFIELLARDENDTISWARSESHGEPMVLYAVPVADPDTPDPLDETTTPSLMLAVPASQGIGARAGGSGASPHLEALLAQLPLGLAMADRDGRLLFANSAFMRAAGREGEDAPTYPTDLVVREDKRALSEAIRRFAQGPSSAGDIAVRLSAQAEDPVSLSLAGVRGLGDAAVLLGLTDTSEETRLKRQVAQATKMQAIGQLAGGVAHDFNNILTAIIGHCDLMLMRHVPGDSDYDDIQQVKSNSNRAAGLTRQLLAFSRQQTLRPQILQLPDIVSDVSNLLKRLLGENVRLDVSHGRNLGAVRADPGQLEQVIVNLAVNARDAMPEGGTLNIQTYAVPAAKAREMRQQILPISDYTALRVSDTGLGIPPDILAKIFEPFFTTKELGKGTGLGLSTVYGIVKQSGGYIFAESELGRGASFVIYLPVYAGADAQQETPVREQVKRAETWGSGTILLVEDEDMVRAVAERALTRQGYTVLTANDGEQGLEVLAAHDGIDLLISDVVMPNMDGPAMVARARVSHPHLPVLFMSGYAEEQLRKSIDIANVAFLPKPFSVNQLAQAARDTMAMQPAAE
ncbi:response regulator, partial [uncultured Sphingobium sp.]|uniref:hybrid sensor histidine kinase/response regulator n=1 Tax=uncultured Sphingobium sp. TaxID=316087 RepID=UPI0026377390